jgi:hypothetical protein
MLVFTNEKFVFRVLRQEIERQGTNHVDSQLILFCMLEGCLRKFCGYAPTAKRGRNLGMPDGHPSGSVSFKLGVRGQAVLIDFESALRNLGWLLVHRKEDAWQDIKDSSGCDDRLPGWAGMSWCRQKRNRAENWSERGPPGSNSEPGEPKLWLSNRVACPNNKLVRWGSTYPRSG